MASSLAGVARARAAESERSAERQAALRRVATAVAQGMPPHDVFSTVDTSWRTRSTSGTPHYSVPNPTQHRAGCGARRIQRGSRCRSANTSHFRADDVAASVLREGRVAPIIVDGQEWAWRW